MNRSYNYIQRFKYINNNSLQSLLESLVFVLVVVVSSGSIRLVFYPYVEDTESHLGSVAISIRAQTESVNPSNQLLLLFPYIYSLFYLLSNWRKTVCVLLTNMMPIVILLILTVASVLWSIDPEVTFRRSFNVLGSSIIGIYLGIRYSPHDFCKRAGKSFLIVCVITILATIFSPSTSIHQDKHFPALHGLFAHKNALGSIMNIGLILGLLLKNSRDTKKLGLYLLFISITLEILSLSRTAWIVSVFIIVLYYLLYLMRTFKAKAIFLFSIIVFFISVISLIIGIIPMLNFITNTLGKSSTLSGRLDIWPTIIETTIKNNFWFGYGYDSFWTSYKGALSVNWGLARFIPLHAHNGWLQMMTHLGIIGVILITYALLLGIIRNFHISLMNRDFLYSFGFIYLMSQIVANFSEVTFLVRDKFFWILILYSLSSISWGKLSYGNVNTASCHLFHGNLERGHAIQNK